MNKQEVINEIEKIDYQNLKYNSPERMLSEQKQLIIDIIDRLEEPQHDTTKKIPQIIAKYLELCKTDNFDFTEDYNLVSYDFINHFDTDLTIEETEEIKMWFYDNDQKENQRRHILFLQAYTYGYEVEKEPQWVVKYKPGNLENNWYFIGFCGGDRTLQPNCASHIDCDTVIKFKDRSKAEAVATLIDGTVEKV